MYHAKLAEKGEYKTDNHEPMGGIRTVIRACRSNSSGDNQLGPPAKGKHANVTQSALRRKQRGRMYTGCHMQQRVNKPARGKPVYTCYHLERCRVGTHPGVRRLRRRGQPMATQAPLLEARRGATGGVRGSRVLRPRPGRVAMCPVAVIVSAWVYLRRAGSRVFEADSMYPARDGCQHKRQQQTGICKRGENDKLTGGRGGVNEALFLLATPRRRERSQTGTNKKLDGAWCSLDVCTHIFAHRGLRVGTCKVLRPRFDPNSVG